jgi:predicted ArsR family transcriptional regulator
MVHWKPGGKRENIGVFGCREDGSSASMVFMFSPAIQDLGKPQWVATIRVLKASGGMAISQLAEALGVSYMAAKQYGEDLTRLGYLVRIRTPRTAVGRPEIFYRVAPKADAMFAGVALEFSMELLESSRMLFGENAPERLIFQYFESLRSAWQRELESKPSQHDRARKLAALREACGVVCSFDPTGGRCPRFIELHHPMARLFEKYPTAISMDTRCIADLLGTRVERVENKVGNTVASVDFFFPEMRATPPNE